MRTFFLVCYLIAALCWLICAVSHFIAARPSSQPLSVGWLMPFGLVWFIIPSIIIAGQSLN
jgi:hypothetical protein